MTELAISHMQLADIEKVWQIEKQSNRFPWSKGNFEAIRNLAQEYLTQAEDYKSDWNYGNAIHHSNLILGKVALREKKIEEAKIYLLKAGRTSGSSQLKSFGPNMSLAKELLEIGENEIVLEYLDLCKIFWRKIFSWWKIRKWKRVIRKGGIPDFGANLVY